MYILPTNDREMENLCDMEQFKGRHNVIMTVKEEENLQSKILY